MSFENNLEQAQQERCGLTGEEVRDVQALWRSVVSEELPQLPEGVDDDTLRTILWKNIRKEFLDALAGVGFERDQKLEMRVQEGSINNLCAATQNS